MKVILEFDAEKDGESQLYKTYVKAEDMSIALWDITQLLRKRLKYESDNFISQTYDELEKIQTEIWDIINEYDLTHLIQ